MHRKTFTSKSLWCLILLPVLLPLVSPPLSNVIQQFSDLLGEYKTENDDTSEPRTWYT